MERWEYKFVPFAEVLYDTSRSSVEGAIERFASTVRSQASDGWEYFRSDHFPVVIRPGCLGALLGVPPASTSFCVLVFRRRAA